MWWRDAVVYQIYVRSFADSNGDGVGDLDGIRARLGYLELLGVDALWLTPFYPSPMADHGYDVADPRNVDPVFGDLAAFDRLLGEAHELGIRIIIDLVPNHTSDRHPWFRAALAARPGSAQRDRYIFRGGKGINGQFPPNNWPSVFGGPAWQRVGDPAPGERAQWYLHLFAPEQPDLNWRNAEVVADLEHTLRFWLDRGVDGFRIDVAHGLSKPDGLPDLNSRTLAAIDVNPLALPDDANDLRFDDDGVHEVHRHIRKVLEEYPERMLVGEVWVRDDERFARYLRPDELHLGFNFRLAQAEYDADAIRSAIDHSLRAVASVGATPTWTLSNHDVVRHPSRYGDGEVGLRRARAMTLVLLALPGTAYLYYGEELGLPQVDLPDWALQDPTWERSGRTDRGRDGARVPLPWEGTAPPYGFSHTADTWLPMPTGWAEHTAEAQLEDPHSTLSLYRLAVELRRSNPGFHGEVEWYGAPAGCFAFRRGKTGVVCALNTSEVAVPLPPGELLATSWPVDDPDNLPTRLPPDCAAWIQP
jgi:alpha-glucosidase